MATVGAAVKPAVTGWIRREYTSAMRLRLLLLHALLSLALVANGIGTAMASVHAGCTHDAVAAAPPASKAHCHESMRMGASTSDNGTHHSDMSPHASTSHHDSCDDCARDCTCACIAHGLAALMSSPLLLSVATGIAYSPAPSYPHTTPTLPHPVRPPIG
jgi:hypothetical protein